jgi:hypothetical protein
LPLLPGPTQSVHWHVGPVPHLPLRVVQRHIRTAAANSTNSPALYPGTAVVSAPECSRRHSSSLLFTGEVVPQQRRQCAPACPAALVLTCVYYWLLMFRILDNPNPYKPILAITLILTDPTVSGGEICSDGARPGWPLAGWARDTWPQRHDVGQEGAGSGMGLYICRSSSRFKMHCYRPGYWRLWPGARE